MIDSYKSLEITPKTARREIARQQQQIIGVTLQHKICNKKLQHKIYNTKFYNTKFATQNFTTQNFTTQNLFYNTKFGITLQHKIWDHFTTQNLGSLYNTNFTIQNFTTQNLGSLYNTKLQHKIYFTTQNLQHKILQHKIYFTTQNLFYNAKFILQRKIWDHFTTQNHMTC